MATSFLTGIVMFSQAPERLAAFYRDTLGIPFELVQHGKLAEHIECEFNNIHFAILKKAQINAKSNIIPSFAVNDLKSFLDELSQQGIEPLHPIIDIGEGKFVSTISDLDGNAIRLIQLSAVTN
jgi:predicted enzyme related to lactoylglutathione lyase